MSEKIITGLVVIAIVIIAIGAGYLSFLGSENRKENFQVKPVSTEINYGYKNTHQNFGGLFFY